MGQGVDPVEITKAGLERAREGGFDTVIIDTAGRQVVDDSLMAELKNIQVMLFAFYVFFCLTNRFNLVCHDFGLLFGEQRIGSAYRRR